MNMICEFNRDLSFQFESVAAVTAAVTAPYIAINTINEFDIKFVYHRFRHKPI